MLGLVSRFRRSPKGLIQVVRREHSKQDKSHAHEEESIVRIDGRHVTWEALNGKSIFHIYEFENTHNVHAAHWICFGKSQDSLAILVNSNTLTIFSPDGDQADIILPNLLSMWIAALPGSVECIIVERSSPDKSDSNMDTARRDLMFLLQPVDTFQPLIVHDYTKEESTAGFDEEQGSIVYTSRKKKGLMVTFNGERHIVWDLTLTNPGNGASNIMHTSKYSVEQKLMALHSAQNHSLSPTIQLRRKKILPHDSMLQTRIAAKRIFAVLLTGVETLHFLLSSEILIGLDTITCTVVYSIKNCIDAAPISTGATTTDIITIRRDGFLHLSRGLTPICKFALHNERVSNDFYAKALHSPYDARVTVNLSKEKAIRIEVVMNTSDKFVDDAIDALSLVLTAAETFAVRVATLELSKYFKNTWSAFALVMFLFTSEIANASQIIGKAWENVSLDRLVEAWYYVETSFDLQSASAVGVEAKKDAFTQWVITTLNSITAYCCQKKASGVLSPERIVRCLHILYEDTKLCTKDWHHVDRMATFLYDICKKNAFPRVIDYMRCYERDCNSLPITMYTVSSRSETINDIYYWLHATRMKGTPPCDLNILPETLPTGDSAPGLRVRLLSHLYASKPEYTKEDVVQNKNHFLSCILRNKLSADFLASFPPGIALPFFEDLRQCRSEPEDDWSAEAYRLIGRPDLAVVTDKALQPSTLYVAPNASISAALIMQNVDHGIASTEDVDGSAQGLLLNSGLRYIASSHNKPPAMYDQSDANGFNLVKALSPMRLININRIEGVCRLLQSSEAENFKVVRSPEMTDHDYEKKKQTTLWLVCTRLCAYPLGRAMLTFGSIPPMIYAEPLPIPAMSMSGTILPSNSIVALDQASSQKLELWPSFHNGVASGLRLFSLVSRTSQSGYFNMHNGMMPTMPLNSVTRIWILYNQRRTSLTHHAGFLYAMGLLHHLSTLAVTDIYEYLAVGHDPTTIGILLGMAAAKDGSSDASISKMLCLHIPALLPQPFAEMDLTSAAQVAAIAGIGLLFRGSGNCLMAEFLLNELSQSRSTARSVDNESYALTAGLALGMVTVGMAQSKTAVPLAELCIAQRLLDAITGGIHALDSVVQERQANGSVSHSSSLPFSYQGTLGDQRQNLHMSRDLNLNVTTSGAVLAFGLYFAKSGSRTAALSLELPDTQVLLQRIRPDLILLHVVSRALILWDTLNPTVLWIESQIPNVVVHSMEHLKKYAASSVITKIPLRADYERFRRVHANILAGACMALGLRYSGTACPAAALTLRHYLGHFAVLRDTYIDEQLRTPGSSQQNDSSMARPAKMKSIARAADRASTAAAVLGIARQYIRDPGDLIAREYLSRAASSTMYDEAVQLRPDRPTLETCLCVTATALSMVMAGTGDLNSLRFLCELRQRVDSETTYGTHAALHMSIGLLFLGGGRASLKRSTDALPALLAAFFPRYPRCANDNQYHLQALRHLWTLAIEWRSIEAVDADTGHVIKVPLTIHMKDQVDFRSPSEVSEVTTLTTPCLLPPLDDIATLSVDSDEFYALKLNMQKSLVYNKVFCDMHVMVKRKDIDVSCLLSYVLNPLEYPSSGFSNTKSIQFSDTQKYLFLKHEASLNNFGVLSEDLSKGFLPTQLGDFTSFPKGPMHDSISPLALSHDNQSIGLRPILELYTQLVEYAMNFENFSSSRRAWSLRLVFDSCAFIIQSGAYKDSIIRPEIILSLSMYIDSKRTSTSYDGLIKPGHSDRRNYHAHLKDCYSILKD